jgi:hypothetical protein
MKRLATIVAGVLGLGTLVVLPSTTASAGVIINNPGVICIGGARTPVFHPGAYGYYGVITETDFIDCDVPGVSYYDRLGLYEFLYKITESPPKNSPPMVATLFGWYTQNEVSAVCTGSGTVSWWGNQMASVYLPGVGTDSNYPSGYNSNYVSAKCSK